MRPEGVIHSFPPLVLEHPPPQWRPGGIPAQLIQIRSMGAAGRQSKTAMQVPEIVVSVSK